jgi:cyanobactin cluster PatC/TenC/TruC protein
MTKAKAKQPTPIDKQEDTTKQTAQASMSAATGLEDYAYWLKTIAKEQAAKAGEERKPFRRGRIWA